MDSISATIISSKTGKELWDMEYEEVMRLYLEAPDEIKSLVEQILIESQSPPEPLD